MSKKLPTPTCRMVSKVWQQKPLWESGQHGTELNQATSRPTGNSGIWQHVKPADHGKELKLAKALSTSWGIILPHLKGERKSLYQTHHFHPTCLQQQFSLQTSINHPLGWEIILHNHDPPPVLAGHEAWLTLSGAAAGLVREKASKLKATLTALQIITPTTTCQIYQPVVTGSILLAGHFWIILDQDWWQFLWCLVQIFDFAFLKNLSIWICGCKLNPFPTCI